MARDSLPPTEQQTWRLIESRLEEISQLVDRQIDPEQFYAELLDSLMPMLAAEEGRIWRGNAADPPRCIARDSDSRGDDGAHEEAGTARITQAFKSNRSFALPPGQSADGICGDPARTVLVCPICRLDEPVAIVEVLLAEPMTDEGRENGLQVLEAVGELAADYERRRRLGELDSRLDNDGDYSRFTARVHRSLELSETLYTVANDGRRSVGCDRLSLLVYVHGKVKFAAISGVDTIDRRSRQFQLLDEFCRNVARQNEAIWYAGGMSDLPPVIEQSLQQYVDDSHAKRLAALLLKHPGSDNEQRPASVTAVMVAEDFTPLQPQLEFRDSLQRVAEISGSAVFNAAEHCAIPLRRLLTSLRRRWRISLPRLIALTVLIAIVVVCFVPARFKISARGALQPLVRQHLFAPEEAVVREVRVRTGTLVRKDDMLMILSKADIDQDLTRVQGELDTAEQMLRSVQANIFAEGSGSSAKVERNDQLAAEEQGLKEKINGLRAQANLLTIRRKSLTVTSPIDGQVLTWNPKQRLKSRPVRAGQQLLTVADPNGPWNLELNVADRDIRHVLEARQSDSEPLIVQFSLATNPGMTYRGTLTHIAPRSESEAGERPTVRVRVSIDSSQVAPLHAGATAVARIDCGTRSLGYIWCRDLWDAIRLYVLF